MTFIQELKEENARLRALLDEERAHFAAALERVATATATATDPLPPAPVAERHPLAELVKGREAEFPTLARAAQNVVPARNPKIEWTVDGEEWFNYTQIFRRRDADSDVARDALLREIEDALKHGVRAISSMSRLLSGYYTYLGRDLLDDDVLTLRPLREAFRRQPWQASGDYEWLAEVALQVVPGASKVEPCESQS